MGGGCESWLVMLISYVYKSEGLADGGMDSFVMAGLELVESKGKEVWNGRGPWGIFVFVVKTT